MELLTQSAVSTGRTECSTGDGGSQAVLLRGKQEVPDFVCVRMGEAASPIFLYMLSCLEGGGGDRGWGAQMRGGLFIHNLQFKKFLNMNA